MDQPFSGPSPYKRDKAMSALLDVRKRLLEEDPEIVEDEKLFSDMLDGEGGDAMDILDSLILAADRADALAAAAKQRADQMQERAKRIKRRGDSLRNACLGVFEVLGIRRRDLPEVTVSLSRAGGSVVIPDPQLVPPQYRRPQEDPPPDKTKIGDALNDGQKFEWAYKSNSAPTLRFSRK